MDVALGPVRVQLQVTVTPTGARTSRTDARERAEHQCAAHSAMVERAYNWERRQRAVENNRMRWENITRWRLCP